MQSCENHTKPKIAAFDLDGTVLHDGRMSDSVRAALHALKKSGVTPVIASGRDTAQIAPEIAECFDYTVAANGAYTVDSSGRVREAHPIGKAQVLFALRAALRHGGCPIIFQNGTMTGAAGAPLLMPGGSLKSYFSVSRKYSKKARFIPFPALYARLNRKPVYKIQGYFRDAASCAAAAAEIMSCPELEVLDMGDNTVEVTLKGVTKAKALAALCGTLGLSPDAMAAFGDSVNDYLMLRSAGLAVAMANGADCVKEIADYIAPDVREDGVARAIYDIWELKRL